MSWSLSRSIRRERRFILRNKGLVTISVGSLVAAIALAIGQVAASDSAPVYPTTTQASADGFYTWTMTVTNPGPPHFTITERNNVSETGILQENVGGNNWKITVTGRLTAIREGGSFGFSVDPDASIFTGTVAVLAAASQTPIASGWALLSLLATLATLGTLAIANKKLRLQEKR